MKITLPVIVIAQFFCTSLWFAGNAVLADMAREFRVPAAFLGHLASAVQLGFIIGTLIFAILAIADRFSASKVFFACALLAAFFNLAVVLPFMNAAGLILSRFVTGFFLAGIYPVGMKIASDYYREGLGKSLGYLVGALVLGTAFPQLVKGFSATLPWRYVIYTTSVLSALGGLALLVFVPDGPFRQPARRPSLLAFLQGFRIPPFRAASLGYFGHMWELYAFWVFVPVILAAYKLRNPDAVFSVPVLSFLVIASGGLSCVAGGYISRFAGVKRTAAAALLLSCLCCFLSPILLFTGQEVLFISFLLVWGMAVVADSPLFSTLVAQSAPPPIRGASLTIVNCIGFSITIVSIQLLNALIKDTDSRYIYMLLGIGPLLGLAALWRKSKSTGHLSPVPNNTGK